MQHATTALFCFLAVASLPGCNDDEPTPGANMALTNVENACDDRGPGGNPSLRDCYTCNTGFEGGNITCSNADNTASEAGTYTVVDCTAVVCTELECRDICE